MGFTMTQLLIGAAVVGGIYYYKEGFDPGPNKQKFKDACTAAQKGRLTYNQHQSLVDACNAADHYESPPGDDGEPLRRPLIGATNDIEAVDYAEHTLVKPRLTQNSESSSESADAAPQEFTGSVNQFARHPTPQPTPPTAA